MDYHDKIKKAFGGVKAPDDTAEKVIKISMGETPKKIRRSYHIGRVVIAALIFTLTTITVLAAAFPELWRNGEFSIEESGIYGMEIKTESGHYPFSEKLREYIRQNEGEPAFDDNYTTIMYAIRFDSFQEASNFFGVPIVKVNFKYNSPISAIIHFDTEKDSAIVYLNAAAKLEIGGNSLYNLHFSINDNPSEPFELALVGGAIENTETYISQITGIETVIRLSPKANVASSLMFALDDVVYTISAWTDYENTDELIAIFQNIVDTIE